MTRWLAFIVFILFAGTWSTASAQTSESVTAEPEVSEEQEAGDSEKGTLSTGAKQDDSATGKKKKSPTDRKKDAPSDKPASKSAESAESSTPVGGPDDSKPEKTKPSPKSTKFQLFPKASKIRSLFGARKKRRNTKLLIDYEMTLKEGYKGRPADSHPGSVLGGALAVMPGVFVHGVGHMYIGETKTGLSLLLAEAVGLGLMFGAAAINEQDNGSAKTAPARLALSHTGFVLFFASWLADIVGTFKGSEPFERDRFKVGGSRLKIGYFYSENPIDDLRHHARLGLLLDLGRVYVNPSMLLELRLAQRRLKFDTGVVALIGADPHNRLSLGFEVERIENEPEGWATVTFMGYIAWRADLGVLLRGLGHFYLVNRTGIGQAKYQFSSRVDHVPALFAHIDSRDEYLFLETGIAVNLSKHSQLTILISHDPMGDIAPAQLEDVGSLSPEFELFKLQFKHRYLNDVEIETEFIGGTGYGIRLGLGYAL